MRNLTIALLLFAFTGLNAQDQLSYHPDGSLQEKRWVEDGRVQFVKYHINGQVEERGAFAAGKADGIWKRYDDSGKLLARVRFVNGLREGKCFYTNFNGEVQYHLEYAQGQLVHGAELNADGEVIAVRDER